MDDAFIIYRNFRWTREKNARSKAAFVRPSKDGDSLDVKEAFLRAEKSLSFKNNCHHQISYYAEKAVCKFIV